MSRILLIGNGYIGRPLAEQLLATGHQVWILRRKPPEHPTRAGWIQADVSQPFNLFSVLPQAPQKIVYILSPDQATPNSYQTVYLQGLQHTLQALSAFNQGSIERIIYVSSTRVYAQNQGEVVDENSETAPQEWKGQCLLEAEKCLLASPFPATVVRLSGIYGPQRTQLLRKLLTTPPTEPNAWTNRIHQADCIGLLKHLLELPTLESHYLGSDQTPTLQRELWEWVQQQVTGQSPSALPSGSETGKQCRSTQVSKSGYSFRYPSYREGYGELMKTL